MNPLYLTVYHTVLGQRRRCRLCGKHQVVDRLAQDKKYHCKYCGHPFRKVELAQRTEERHR